MHIKALFFAISVVGFLLALPSALKGCQSLGQITCTENVTTLSELLSRAEEFNTAYENTTVCVNLDPKDVSTLGYSDIAMKFSAIILGSNTTISCEPWNNMSGYTQFPLRFNGSRVVVIHELTFEGCARPLQFELVQKIQISTSHFRNFSPGGTIEISNSPVICIQNSIFLNGISLGIGNREFSGNAGGVAIGYNVSFTNNPPDITITGCEFRNNIANAIAGYKYTILQVLSRKIYNQRGGGMAIYFGASNYSGTINIRDTVIADNKALDSGGGVYMFLGGTDSYQNITIYNTNFTGSESRDGGGLEITHFNARSYEQPNHVTIVNCRFSENVGNFGGGYENIQLHPTSNLNNLIIRDTLFEGNRAIVGAGVYLQSVETVNKVTLLNHITLENCTFSSNTGKRGIIFVIGNVITIRGNTILEGSVGPALRVLGTLVTLKDNIIFRNNINHPTGLSGAIYLSSFGQIILHAQTTITFLNNNGTDGACIVVKGQLIAAAFTRQLYNPQCFLQYEEPTTPPPDWKVTMNFEGNSADLGPVVFMSDSEICEWTSTTKPFFSMGNLTKTWTFMEMRNNLVNGTDQRERYIQTGISSLDLATTNVSAYPGQTIKLDATALDQFGQSTSSFIGISAPPDSGITFQPSIVPLSSKNETLEFQYSGEADQSNTTVYLNPIFTSEQNIESFTLFHDFCLPGHTLNSDLKCTCNTSERVILCQGDVGLLLEEGLWGAPASWSHELLTYECPPKYCNCHGSLYNSDLNEGCQLLYDDGDAICQWNRTGKLCGRCRNNYGVGMLTNICRSHHGPPQYYWLVPIYIIALIVMLVVLVRLGIKIPTILRGFLFYIQIAPISVVYFRGIDLISEPLSCIASALALYVPYDFTFHKELTSLESYGLRYFAPLIALIVIPIAARVRRHRFKYWHGIWTIILLMYVMTVETSVSLLFCPTLKSRSNSITLWFFDGEEECYRGWHMFLTIVAIVSLLFQALLILFVAASVYYKTLRRKYVKFEKLERFSIVVTHGMKHEYKWWPIIELVCRYIFVIAVILSPGYVVVPLVLSIVIFVMQAIIHPYEDKLANYVESIIFLWLVGLLSLGNTTALHDSNSNKKIWPLLYIPVMCGFIVFIIHIVLQIRKLLLLHKDKIKNNLKIKSSLAKGNIQIGQSFIAQSFIASHGIRRINDVTKTVVGLGEPNTTDDDPLDTFL